MFGTSICMGKTSKETTNEQSREEQTVQVPTPAKHGQDVHKPKTEEERMESKARKPKGTRIKRSEVTVSMQTLRF